MDTPEVDYDTEPMMTDSTIRLLTLVNHDQQFERSVQHFGAQPAVLNDYDLTTPDFIATITELISSDGNGYDFIARCHCGDIEGDSRIGMFCPTCRTTVSKPDEEPDDNLVCRNWLRCPEELPCGWLSPKVYMILASWLSYERKRKGGKNYLDDIINVEATLPFDITHVVQGQGFVYLYDNFNRIMEFFIHDHPTTSQDANTPAIKLLLDVYRDRLWCHYIPILPAALNPITRPDHDGSGRRKQADPIADKILSAAITLSNVDFGHRRVHGRQLHVERSVYVAYKNIIEYNDEATGKFLSVKKAIPRTQLLGSRFHTSFRGVIVPIIGDHNYFELHLPWKMMISTFRAMIHGILCNRYNFDMNQAVSRARRAMNIYDPLIDEILQSLIDDSPFPGIAVLWQRPPSIRDGSVILKFITNFHRDPEESAIAMTPTDVAYQNADKTLIIF